VEPVALESLEERGGLLVIPAEDAPIDDDLVRRLRDADRK
jgi:hypothetical protein